MEGLSTCQRCPALVSSRKCVVLGAGRAVRPLLMVVGEAPGADEDKGGTPFVGASGKLLRATLAQFGLDQSKVYFTNAVKCHPEGNRDPSTEELENCSDYLLDEIEAIQPRAILTVGRIPDKALETVLIRAHPEGIAATLYNVYHPAYILRQPRKREAWIARIKEIADAALADGPGDLAGSERPVRSSPVGGHGDWIEGPVDYASPWLAADTEYDTLSEDPDGSTHVSTQVSDGERAVFYQPMPALEGGADAGRIWRREVGGPESARSQGRPGAEAGAETPAGDGSSAQLPGGAQPPLLQLAAPDRGDASGEPGDESEGILAAVRGAERQSFFPKGRRVWCHNVKADYLNLGIDLWDLDTWDDTALVAYVLRFPEVGLKKIGPELTGIPMEKITDLLRENIRTVTRIQNGSVCYDTEAKQHHKPWRAQYWTFLEDGKRKRANVRCATELDAYCWIWALRLPPLREVVKERWERIPFSRALELYPERARQYALTDAVVTSRLARVLWAKLEAEPRLLNYYVNFEKPTVPVLADMERRGVLVDERTLDYVRQVLEDKIRTLGLEAMSGLHLLSVDELNSTRKVADALRWFLGLDLKRKTPTGLWQVDRATLLELAGVASEEDLYKRVEAQNDDTDRVLAALLSYRQHTKLKSTYVDALLAARDSHGRVHGRFNQMVTDTNRLSSSGPNLQNIPARTELGKRIRRAFIARPGYVLVKADFSQLEVRIYAHFTQEPVLVRAYTAQPELDVHQSVADEIGIPRKRAKNVLFGAVYGADAPKLAETAGVVGGEAAAFLARLRDRLPSLLTWQQRIGDQLARQGYVETLFGWRNYYPLFWSPIRREQRAALREAANMPIQGTAGGILKLLFQHAQPVVEEYGAELVLTVHDEVVYEVPEPQAAGFAAALQPLGYETGLGWLSVPLKLEVEIGRNWADTRPYLEWDGR